MTLKDFHAVASRFLREHNPHEHEVPWQQRINEEQILMRRLADVADAYYWQLISTDRKAGNEILG